MRNLIADRAAARVGLRPLVFAVVATASLGWTPGVFAQDEAAGPAHPAHRLLAGRFLTDEERKDIRVRFGLWTEADMDTPARKARAALIVGRWDDPALADPAADPLDTAEALLFLGRPAESLARLDGLGETNEPIRAGRLRGESLDLLGRIVDADAALTGVVRSARANPPTRASEAVEAVRALMILQRLPDGEGKPRGGAGPYHEMMGMLRRAAEEVDRLEWLVPLTEGMLLAEKDNRAEGEKALREALALNARSGWAAFAMGSLAVEGFALAEAETIAGKIEGGAAGSALATIVRARARLRQSDAAGALEALAPALERFPDQPVLLAVQAAATAASFDEPGTQRLLGEFERRFPGSALAYVEIGRVLAEARQYAESSAYLAEASRRAPGWSRPLIERGLMEVQAGRDEEATRDLERAVALDPFNVRADNSLRLLRELATYARLESEHFAVRYKPGVDEVLAREMLPVLEAAHRRVAGADRGGIDHSPPFKTLIELMPDHRWFAVRIAGMPAIHTIAAATGPVIAMEAPREGPHHKVGAYDWARVIKHEYVHTVTLSRTRNRIPHWFTEAAAVYLEDAPRDYSACQILARAVSTGTLFDFEQINLAFVRPRKATDRSQAYAQGHWMYAYLVERFGPRAPLDLMDLYAKGVREPEAFPKVLGLSREAFFDEFKAWALAEARAWGMIPPEGVPTVRELLARDRGAKAADEEDDDGPTPALIERWLGEYPDHPGVLELAVRGALKASNQSATAAMVPLLERYAKARPVDPLPHKLLASWFTAGEGSASPDAGRRAIEHLEYLDAREQYQFAYAMELSRRYAEMGDLTRSWDKALRAVRIAPYNPRTRELAASVAITAGRFDDAEWQIKALTILEPERDLHRRRLEALQRLRDKAGGH
ncbi:MAG: hypothetical protein HRU70_07855 [Phycisphaeraceae bacterium]|nr:MAG: hypothetical protein HRU70_07855 [Phycisphaeraceae bacterium]